QHSRGIPGFATRDDKPAFFEDALRSRVVFGYIRFERAVLYDFRQESPTRGASEVVDMGEANRVALYIPKGVAHGFLALRESYMTYLVDEFYDNSDELGILWNDPALKVDWGASSEPSLSDRDRQNPRIADITPDRRPR
ncbi:MAG: dTDP-4-dehydrorhamnose 3,5-epimerase, partial [Myxococcales bacterium]